MPRPMANDPPFATLKHFTGDLGIPSESDSLRIGIRTSGLPMPKLVGRQLRALDQRLQLRPHDRWMDTLHIRTLRETAIRTGDDVLAADKRCEANDSLGNELRMLDDVGGVADHAGDQHLIRR